MKLAFVYGPFSVGARPFDFASLYESPRGLTGSEISCIQYACAMADREHDVTLVVAQDLGAPDPPTLFMLRGSKRPIRLLGLQHFNPVAEHYDAVLAWNEPDMLRGVPPTTLRVLDQQLNDFSYCQPGWQGFVDMFTSPSQHHLEHVLACEMGDSTGPKAETFPWRTAVVPNGCDPSEYASAEQRVPGRVIWASSADRGLHLLLQAWPDIKARVPHASLRCYYHWSYDGLMAYEYPQGHSPGILEIAQRARYIARAVQVMAPLDVQHVGSVSRDGIRDAFMQAEVLGFPCETIRYTEGFSVTTLEACASGAIPVIADCDALPSIYTGMPSVPYPPSEHMDEYIELVVRALTDAGWAAEQRLKGRAIAEAHAWPVLAERLERTLLEAGVFKEPT